MDLFVAIRRNDLQQVKECIKHDVNIHYDKGNALRYAVDNGCFEIVKYLVEYGTDIHIWNDYPLRIAALYGYSDIVKYLVEHGADIHADNDYALRWAANKGHFDIVKYLIPLYNNKEELKTLFFRVNNFYTKFLILEQLYGT
ncbi:ankyrin repeat domain-containing protein [Candidatus Pacearchaeota archaeon]|nr:ankyrin repeat domain-containing protein [Candidatus Pacearchaeota archaeon]